MLHIRPGIRRGLCCALPTLLSFATCAQAQQGGDSAGSATPAAGVFSANLALASQYVSRGFRQTWGEPAVQGGFDYVHPSGWSAGTWMSSVSSKFIEGGSVEWDLYAGYNGTLGDLGYGAQVYYYLYPGARLAYADTRYDYGEVAVSLGYKWLSAKYWLTYTPDYFGYNSSSLLTGDGLRSRGSGYAEVNATFDLGHGSALVLHYGQQRVRNFAAYGFRDARIALSRSFGGGWTLTGACTRGWGRTDAYDRYTTGATDSAGHPAVSNPLRTTYLVSVARAF
jgi:uncharacterized protein (TIGR02001 family)